MKRSTLILTSVLAAQIVLALLLTMSGSDQAAFKAGKPLLAFDKAKVNRIAVDEAGGSSVTLEKENGKWIIPAMAGFPANQNLVDSLLTKMSELKKGWPVATTSAAAERFKVAEKTHDRRVVLKSGDKTVAELFIGSAPTYRQSHVRSANDDAIYNVAMAAYDAASRNEEWMNRDYLVTPRDKISGLSIGDVVIEKKDGKFTLTGLAPDDKVKESDVQRLVGVAINPSFDAVEGKGKEALAKVEPADIALTVKLTEGEPIVYKFKKEGEGKSYLLASSAHDYVFRVAASTIQPVEDVRREKLIEPKKTEEKPEAPPQASSDKPIEGSGG
ncbi:MAG: DUF4340 domain-containing protein [Rhodomicrobium sp.]|nr:DUF4340 domain-containing protein [Rhodomicrobium sp.]